IAMGFRRWKMLLILPPLVVAACAVLTWRQTHVYRDLETLWTDTIQKNPDAWIAHNNYGNILLERDQFDDAQHEYEQVLRIKPGHAGAITSLGIIAMRKGNLATAERRFREALAIAQRDPLWTPALPHAQLGTL